MADPTAATNMRAAQVRVRQEAEEMHDVLADLRRWEENVKTKDDALKSVASRKAKPQYGTETIAPAIEFDASNTVSEDGFALGTLSAVVAEATTEREKGNGHFKRGEFQQAVKCYTRSIALYPKDVLGYSNRSMAYLRLKEYVRALDDATAALSLDSSHVKSLMRRAAAANGIGRHRMAEQDLMLASQLEPANKQVVADLRKTQELRKTAIRNAPATSIPIRVMTEESRPRPQTSVLEVD